MSIAPLNCRYAVMVKCFKYFRFALREQTNLKTNRNYLNHLTDPIGQQSESDVELMRNRWSWVPELLGNRFLVKVALACSASQIIAASKNFRQKYQIPLPLTERYQSKTIHVC